MSPTVRTLDDVFALFESRTNLEKGLPPGNPNRVYRLDRMRALCAAYGNPQNAYRTIHLAGSKGKGSTAAYIAALLKAAGRRVGVYASPHLIDYRERFRIEGEKFPEETALETARLLLRRLPDLEKNLPGEGDATTFELLTLFAFLLFRETGCDTAVMETGLGGRLDATNIISSPEAVVFTPVEKEHTEVLGSKLKRIAAEKAGILKSGTRAWSAGQSFIPRQIFRRQTHRAGVKLTELRSSLRCINQVPPDGNGDCEFAWQLLWKDGRREVVKLAMGGQIQAENAALALLISRELEPTLRDDSNMEAAGISALTGVSLPGRFQYLRHQPVIIIDGAHTARSVSALVEAFAQVTKNPAGDTPLLLFGSVEGKDDKAMAHKLCGSRKTRFKEVIISTPGTFKPSNPQKVAESFRQTGARVTLIPEPEIAWQTAMERAGTTRPILVTGSFYMAGEIARLMHPFTFLTGESARVSPLLPR